jgi:hypothetical protein
MAMKEFSQYKDELNNSGKRYTIEEKSYIIHTFSFWQYQKLRDCLIFFSNRLLL